MHVSWPILVVLILGMILIAVVAGQIGQASFDRVTEADAKLAEADAKMKQAEEKMKQAEEKMKQAEEKLAEETPEGVAKKQAEAAVAMREAETKLAEAEAKLENAEKVLKAAEHIAAAKVDLDDAPPNERTMGELTSSEQVFVMQLVEMEREVSNNPRAVAELTRIQETAALCEFSCDAQELRVLDRKLDEIFRDLTDVCVERHLEQARMDSINVSPQLIRDSCSGFWDGVLLYYGLR